MGFTFQLAGIEAALFEGLGPVDPEGESNAQIKQLRQGGVRDLNLYIVHEIQDNVAGYACVVLSSTLTSLLHFRTFEPWKRQPGLNSPPYVHRLYPT